MNWFALSLRWTEKYTVNWSNAISGAKKNYVLIVIIMTTIVITKRTVEISWSGLFTMTRSDVNEFTSVGIQTWNISPTHTWQHEEKFSVEKLNFRNHRRWFAVLIIWTVNIFLIPFAHKQILRLVYSTRKKWNMIICSTLRPQVND